MTATIRRTADDVLQTVLDAGSYRSWDSGPLHRGADAAHLRLLGVAASRSGSDEAVRTGEGRIAGRPVPTPATRSVPPGCARPGGASGWRPSSGCRWSR